MSRSLWFAAGAGAGVYTMVRLRRAAEILTADGLADRLGALRVGARLLREEVAHGRAEVESDLRRRLVAPHPGTPLELPEPPRDDREREPRQEGPH